MTCSDRQETPSSGFALLVVLSVLAILTLLFAISSARSLAHLKYQRAEARLAADHFRDQELLKAIVQRGELSDLQTGETGSILLAGTFETYRAVDVGGLVDLNTAAPPLLEALFAGLGLGPQDLDVFRQWRQQSRRLLRVEDLGRIVDQDVDSARLLQSTTVFSGRSGIALDAAPDDVLDVFTENADPSQFGSQPSNSSYAIVKDGKPIGVVFFAPSDNHRVLELR